MTLPESFMVVIVVVSSSTELAMVGRASLCRQGSRFHVVQG